MNTATLLIESDPPISFDLGFEDLGVAARGLADSRRNQKLFAALALHPASAVREAIAGKENLAVATVALLASDESLSVVQTLLATERASWALTTEQLTQMIGRDVDLAATIADKLLAFEKADTSTVGDLLAAHSDPKVRLALAESSGTPRSVLKRLTKDLDAMVRNFASGTLEEVS